MFCLNQIADTARRGMKKAGFPPPRFSLYLYELQAVAARFDYFLDVGRGEPERLGVVARVDAEARAAAQVFVHEDFDVRGAVVEHAERRDGALDEAEVGHEAVFRRP